MIFERVKHGKAFGEQVFVCKQSTFDRISFAADRADVWKSELEHSRIRGNARVRNSRIQFSTVEGDSEVTNSRLVHTTVTGGTILGASIAQSEISGDAQILGTPGCHIVDSKLSGNAIVEGGAVVIGVELNKRMRIRDGIWQRAPRYIDLETSTTSIGVTEGINGTALIGCRAQKMTDWIRKKHLWLKVGRWSEEMGDLLEATFTHWLNNPIPTN